MSVCVHASSHGGQKEGTGSLGTGVRGSSEPSNMDAGPLREQQLLLTTEPPLRSPKTSKKGSLSVLLDSQSPLQKN